MRKRLLRGAEVYVKQNKHHRTRNKVVRFLACIVVFCTTYALILPAITMQASCPLEEHTHSESCYQKITAQTVTTLSCSYETLNVHVHSEECRDAEGLLTCGLADFVVHTHSDDCYDGSGALLCQLPEVKTHEHTDSCYKAVESEPEEETKPAEEEAEPVEEETEQITEVHEHDDSCYTVTRGELICQIPEVAEEDSHLHTDSCYCQGELVCQLSETEGHRHSTSCYAQGDMVCELPESEEHSHGDSCYAQGPLICALPEEEAHSHTAECYTSVLGCGLDERPAHQHTDACYEQVKTLSCQLEVAPEEAPAKEPEVTESGEEPEVTAPADEAPAELKLICKKDVILLHSHTQECFEEYLDENNAIQARLVCTKTVVTEHRHSEGCYTVAEVPLENTEELTCTIPENHIHGEGCLDEAGVLACKLPEGHVHSTLCYGTWKLICDKEAHTHDGSCTALLALSATEQAQVEDVIAQIAKLPTYEELAATLYAYEEVEDYTAYENYYMQIGQAGLSAYNAYMQLSQEQQALVSNFDRLMELSSVWSVATLEWNEQAVNVYARNAVGSRTDRPILFYGKNSPQDWIGNATAPGNWRAILVRESGVTGRLYVYYITGEAGFDHFKTWSNQYADYNGDGNIVSFMLLVPVAYYNSNIPDVEVGDLVTVEARPDFVAATTAGVYDYNHRLQTTSDAAPGVSTGLWNIYFGSSKKADKNNDLTVIPSADTYDLITVNLFNYNSNINSKYNANANFPGFQQDYGTESIGDDFGALSFNFGNNITADIDAGHSDVTAVNATGPINRITKIDGSNYADVPITGAMEKLLSNRYPMLTDGFSLDFYFNPIGAPYGVNKMNTDNITGLFQYDRKTGKYYYDSRENHAQFNASNNTFVLYKQIMTPNFIMYPFGNFMPFNDIVNDCVRADHADRQYLLEIANSARWKAENGYGTRYQTLANVLYKFVDLMDTKYNTREWTSGNALMEYFSRAFPNTMSTEKLNNILPWIYNLDYDTPSDFYFGMNMRMDLMQPKNGLTGEDTNGDGQSDYPMVFEFTGDDDIWVYVDNVLFLDLSGIHRHVGGKIDFANGLVHYYAFDSYIDGAVKSTPYKTQTFAQILQAAGKSTDVLNDKGTFEDYSVHTFDFFYTERGSGSSLCNISFNFPLLKQNAISVAKELSVDDPSKTDLIGNPDYYFQVLKADSNGNKTQDLFIGSGVQYTVYSKENDVIGTRTTGENGVFTLKAGQRAEFGGIAENAGKYYVRELLNTEDYAQFGQITVNGTSATVSSNIRIGADVFTGLESNVKDASNGTTLFRLNNQVTFHKLGSLSVSKQMQGSSDPDAIFNMNVTLDGKPLPAGTAYTLSEGSSGTVTTAGIIPLRAGQTATVSGIFSGTPFTVSESSDSSTGYIVSYAQENGTDVTVSADQVSGTIVTDTDIKITVTNALNATSVTIPGTKALSNGGLSSGQHSYSIVLSRTSAKDGNGTPLELFSNYSDTKAVTVSGSQPTAFEYELHYTQAQFEGVSAFPVTLTYEIRELSEGITDASTDPAVYTATVTVSKDTGGKLIAELTSLKNGTSEVSSKTAAFTNTLISDLTLKKVLENAKTPLQGYTFTFRIRLTDPSGTPLKNQSFSTTVSGNIAPKTSVTTDSDGYFTLTGFQHNDTAVIHGLPAGTKWTAEEMNADGFIVSWQSGATSSAGSVASGSLPYGSASVVFTNVCSYELPHTGGDGTNLYTLGGIALILVSAAGLVYSKKRRRGDV